MFDLKGKIALVAGASRGRGWAMASSLAEAGATVILNGRDVQALDLLRAGDAGHRLGGQATNLRGRVLNLGLGLVLAGGATYWLARLFEKRIGGYTGDCLGATQQFAELAFYGGLLCQFS